jgi:hypothetical protein
MDAQRQKGASVFAIPHNGNVSDGRMFETVKFNGKPIDAAYRNAGRPGAPGMSRRPACRATTRALVAKKGRQA